MFVLRFHFKIRIHSLLLQIGVTVKIKLFEGNATLKSKNITTDRRLNCASPIEFTYYTVQHQAKATVGRCAFCGDKLDRSSTKTVKTLLDKECKVLPSCGKPACLSMNPKANFQNGWTLKTKQTRKRKQNTGEKGKAKKSKKANKNGLKEETKARKLVLLETQALRR